MFPANIKPRNGVTQYARASSGKGEMDSGNGCPWGRELVAGEYGEDGGPFVPLESGVMYKFFLLRTIIINDQLHNLRRVAQVKGTPVGGVVPSQQEGWAWGLFLSHPPAPSWPWVSSSQYTLQTHMRQSHFCLVFRGSVFPLLRESLSASRKRPMCANMNTNGDNITAPNHLRKFLEANIKNIFMTLGICKNFLNSAQK